MQHDKWARLNPYLVPKPAITYIVTEKGSERLNLQSAWDAKREEKADVDAKSYIRHFKDKLTLHLYQAGPALCFGVNLDGI